MVSSKANTHLSTLIYEREVYNCNNGKQLLAYLHLHCYSFGLQDKNYTGLPITQQLPSQSCLLRYCDKSLF